MRWLLSLLLLLAAPLYAQAVSRQPHTTAELIAETTAPRPGQTFRVGIALTPQPKWHTYWKNPGDSGMETQAAWEGASVTPFRYPTPKTYLTSGIMNHVYEGRAVLLADATVPADWRGGPLAVKLDWLVCDDELCVPETATLSVPLTAGDGARDPAAAAALDTAAAALPRSVAGAALAVEGGRWRLALPVAADGVRAAHFFALTDGIVEAAGAQAAGSSGDGLVLEGPAVANAAAAPLEGVVRVERADGRIEGFAVKAAPGAVPAARPLGASAGLDWAAFAGAFGLAVLGGLVLNVMPCVFPILSLKAMSLARAGSDARTARMEGLAYTAGVVLICATLGGAAIALAAAGRGAGWAFQLQDPRVIALLMLLALAIALNFAGLFEMSAGRLANAGGALASRPGAAGAFWTGALAAVVATPCTGPFMAGALGAALVLPPAAGLAVFAGLGLGLALPFLLLGFVPALRRMLPRPGPWMARFRRILSVPMFLTALALAWVLGRQAGADGLVLGLAAALAVGLGLWWFGRRQGAMRPGWAALAVAALGAVAAPVALSGMSAPAVAAEGQEGGVLAAQAWSPEREAALRASAKPLFVYFTADWCLTCKVNERGALSRPEVSARFRDAGVTVLVGDWTRPDPRIAAYLERRGRAGIPLYIFVGADGREVELPQLLTVSQLTALVGEKA